MPCRRVSTNSFDQDDSVDRPIGPSLCSSLLVGMRRPFVLAPGNIGLPVVSEMPPAAFELLAPLWWLDSMKCQTEPWTTVVYDRGKTQHLHRVRILPRESGPARGVCSVLVVCENAVQDTAGSSNGGAETSETLENTARIEVVTDLFAIHRIFNAARHLGVRCIVHSGCGRSRTAEICVADHDDNYLQLVLLNAGGIESQWVELRGLCSIFRFPLTVCSRQSKSRFELPQYVVRIRRRRQIRVRAPQCLTLTLEFAGQILTTDLLDVSAMGVRLSYDCGLKSPFPGLTFPAAAMHRDGREVWNGVLQVTFAGRREGIGACLSAAGPGTANAWHELMDDLMHPRNRTGGGCAGVAWDTFQRSGYFNLSGKAPRDFDSRRVEFEEVNRKLDERRSLGGLIHNSYYSGITASVSVAKYFSRSWLVHQLAKSDLTRDVPNALRALQDVYLQAYEVCTRDASNRWTVIYTEGHVSWHVRSHLAFASRHAESVCVCPIQLLELSTNAPTSRIDVASNLNIDIAASRDCEQLLEILAARRPLAYREALDLMPESLDVAAIGSAYATIGIGRERRVFVARQAGKSIAWLIADKCTPTLNLFRLFDSIRIVPCSDLGTLAYGQLIDAAREWYLEGGKNAFVCAFEDGNWDVDGLRDADDLGVGQMWICAASAVLDFIEHVVEVTSPLAPERRREVELLRAG
jgi:hypothetical protein